MYNRHTHLFITPAGRKRIYKMALSQGLDELECRWLLFPELSTEPAILGRPSHFQLGIPAIVRREEGLVSQNQIPVGFSSWRKLAGQRLRLATFVTPSEVIKAVTPDVVLTDWLANNSQPKRTKALNALTALARAAEFSVFSLGVWGSTAMEILTGYFYTDENSDLDVLLTLVNPYEDKDVINSSLVYWRWVIDKIQVQYDLCIDMEVSLPNGYGVSLKEFFSNGDTILGKGLRDVALLTKKQLFESLNH